jgi:two-component system nitrogen regulation response regulator NtrX
MKHRILIVDDEEGIRQSLSAILADEGYDAEAVPSGEACLAALDARPAAVVLLDVWLPGIDGIETLKQIRETGSPAMAVMISGHANIETAVRATKLGAFDFIEKPLELEKIILVVKNAVEHLRLESENRRLREELSSRYQVIGGSVPMKALRQQIAVAAPTTGRVLIYGESGTGKEVVARALHAASLRSARPFVEMNCAAIPDELIESELFGHLRGSFTGAHEDKIGKFQRADGGTLFLDEVGDMSLRTQSKVLRVLEEQSVEPLGSNRALRVDVRVIAATNKRLDDEIARDRFREDLFYRLNVVPFVIPALRERIEDVPVLAQYFLDGYTGAYGRQAKELSDGAIEVMMRYSWPGNVRELRNVIERLVIVCPQAHIEPHHLPPELFRSSGHTPQAPPATLHEARAAYERDFILRKLEENQWNMTRTASAIGLERSHLYRKMKSLGISPEEKEEKAGESDTE